VNASDRLSAVAAVEQFSKASGQELLLVRRLAGGETGAHEVRTPSGRRFVLKWETDPQTMAARRRGHELTQRLFHEAGWPVPHQRLLDTSRCLYILQEFMPGMSPRRLSHARVTELADIHERRRNLAVTDDTNAWGVGVIQTLTTGGNGYCLHESLRRYTPRTAALVARIEMFGRSLTPSELQGNDIVHWDLHPGNLLVRGDDRTGVIDTDFVTRGDASFDLVTLALASSEIECDTTVSERLWKWVERTTDEMRRQTYLAHLFVRFLDWPIRRRAHDEVNFWLEQADKLLDV